MKSVLISIQPKWCELIASGKKTIEVRKSIPKIGEAFKCYIYCTKGTFDITACPDLNADSVKKVSDSRGKVIGEFICNTISSYHGIVPNVELYGYAIPDIDIDKMCLSAKKLLEYGNGKTLYGWHISDLKIYDIPKELSEFQSTKECPQAYYQEETGDWFCEDGETEDAVIDKEKEFPYEDECAYFNCPRCGGENYDYEDYAYCMCSGYKPIIRPPQSWCFCEEIK